MSKKTKKRKLKARRNKANHGKRPPRRSLARRVEPRQRRQRRSRRRASGRPSRPRPAGASCTTPTTRSAIVVARQLGAPRLVGASRTRGGCRTAACTRARAPPRARAGGSRVQRNAGSSPSIASTTSSTRDLRGRAREPVAAARALHRLEHARACERLQVLGEVRRRARRGTRRAWPRAARRRAGSTASSVHACTPHSTPSDSLIITDTTCPRYRDSLALGTDAPPPMATVDEVELLPDAEQHKLLVGDARAGQPREQRGARRRAAAATPSRARRCAKS